MASESTTDATTSGPTAKKATAKKTTAKKSAAKKSASKTSSARSASKSSSSPSTSSAGSRSTSSRLGAAAVARRAVEQLASLTGRIPECVVGVESNDDGWSVAIEVVESRRIPDSTDVLATYVVQCGADGDLLGYRRASRYIRGKGGERD